jgi:hypothetical protein
MVVGTAVLAPAQLYCCADHFADLQQKQLSAETNHNYC